MTHLSRLQWWRRVSAPETREHLFDAEYPARSVCTRIVKASWQRWAQVDEPDYKCRNCEARRNEIEAGLALREARR